MKQLECQVYGIRSAHLEHRHISGLTQMVQAPAVHPVRAGAPADSKKFRIAESARLVGTLDTNELAIVPFHLITNCCSLSKNVCNIYFRHTHKACVKSLVMVLITKSCLQLVRVCHTQKLATDRSLQVLCCNTVDHGCNVHSDWVVWFNHHSERQDL